MYALTWIHTRWKSIIKDTQSTTCAQKHSLLLATLCRHLNASWSYSRRMHLPMRKVEPVWLTWWVWTDTRRALSSGCTTFSAFGRCEGRPVGQRVFMRHGSPPSSSWGWCRGIFRTEEILKWSILFTNVSVTETPHHFKAMSFVELMIGYTVLVKCPLPPQLN